ncbi:peptidoglycan DD-metalloendopeptidase family protein [Microvirga massiliensis]|uniref:peptidoglycan DD-metalloendopeptidase family protein n=1 Tax=Microvirga massiliensis TaxID=1033741 RepID=UPI00062BC0E2|nr:M23 family metallopeptidase [Microvirga massiliensis]
MSVCVGDRGLGAVSRFALVVLIGGAASACSSDTVRFAENPFSNPFATTTAHQTPPPSTSWESAPPAPAVAAVPTAPVQTAALPPLASQPSAAPRNPVSPPVTASGTGGWTATGGTPVTVASGDDLNAISRRYGVPGSAILAANGLSHAGQVSAGRQITIPVYSTAASRTAVAASTPPQRPTAPVPQPKFRLVESAKPAASAPAKPVKASFAATPVVATTAPKASAAPAVAKAPAPQPAAATQVVAAKPVEKAVEKPAEARVAVARVEAPVAKPATAAVVEPTKPAEVEQTASLAAPPTDFRWPARGRVIAGFGSNGGNEGINIALPEGTPVKATEAGTVTYAGSEVKGYGNLVLIRHENGYISAYAHNGELSVKRGERVKRGQVIARSGQTGNVTSPQLHFEIRKGQTPVDPIAHLSGS